MRGPGDLDIGRGELAGHRHFELVPELRPGSTGATSSRPSTDGLDTSTNDTSG